MTSAMIKVIDQVGAYPGLTGTAEQTFLPPPLVNEDIVRLILEYYSDSCEDQPSRNSYHRDLTMFSRISRVWTRPAQELLSFHATFSEFYLYEQFVSSKPQQMRLRDQLSRLMWTAPRSYLCMYIRIFEVNIGEPKSSFKCSQLPMVLRDLPRVFELRLNFEDQEPKDLSKGTIHELSSVPNPPCALRITMRQLWGFSKVVPQILELPWPIQYLEISESCPEPSRWVTWDLLWRIRPSLALQLRDFRWRAFIQDCEDSLLWVLQASIKAGSLRSLHIPQSLKRFDIQYIAPNLTSLHISVHTMFDFYPRMCGNAPRIYVVYVPRTLPVQEMRISGSLGWPLGYLRNRLPPTVTKLQLDSSNSVEEAQNIVKTLRTLPEGVQELTLVRREDAISTGEVEEEYVRAVSECQRQGVELMRRPEWQVNKPHFAPVARSRTNPILA